MKNQCKCGNIFTWKPIKGLSRKYCSNECKEKYRVIKVKKEPLIVKDICICGNEFIKKFSQHKYCSLACRVNNTNSISWIGLRFRILEKYKFTCQYCGSKAPEVQLYIDHIKPQKLYPELRLDINNLTVACCNCNLGKSDSDICLDYHLKSKNI